MTNLLTGLLAMLMLLVFLGDYAVRIGSVPLWIIIVGVLMLALYDFLQSVRGGNGNSRG